MKAKRLAQLRNVLLLFLLMFGVNQLFAQDLSYDKSLEVVLNDGTNIYLYGTMSGNNYYYLPPSNSLKLSKKPDGTPEFLFMKFTTDEKEDVGGVQGALMHFLMEWGLTQDQLEDLGEKVKEATNGRGVVKGPVDLQPKETESFKIVSAVLEDKKLTPTFSTSGMAPPMAGNKAAVAARLDKNGAQLLASTFEKSRSITDVSLALNYDYVLKMKAGSGKLTYKWSLLQKSSEGLAYDYIRKELDNRPAQLQSALDEFNKNKGKLNNDCGLGSAMGDLLIAAQAADKAIGNTSSGGSGGTYEYHIGESLMRNIYDYLNEKEVIVLQWEGGDVDDERVDAIRTAMFEYFLNGFTDDEFPELISTERLAIDEPENNIKDNAEGSYSFKGCSQLTSQRTRDKTLILKDIILPVKRSHQMVNNLASTYDMVKNNKKCVNSVNLNDPFFQHRDINFIVDLEALEIFEKEVNYVTVNVRKKRSDNDFKDHVTITKDFIENNGSLAVMTYARGDDRNSDIYEYKAQWSLRGGNLYPENPQWKKGDWEGVTLASPIKPRMIEFEADLDELKEAGIVRATLQLRYYKFGKEVETNIPMTVSKGEPLIEETIFTDADSKGYVYRLILTHKEQGKLAFDWKSKINDNYVYASLPDGLNDLESDLINDAKEAGKNILDVTKDKVLNKFSEILGVTTE